MLFNCAILIIYACKWIRLWTPFHKTDIEISKRNYFLIAVFHFIRALWKHSVNMLDMILFLLICIEPVCWSFFQIIRTDFLVSGLARCFNLEILHHTHRHTESCNEAGVLDNPLSFGWLWLMTGPVSDYILIKRESE